MPTNREDYMKRYYAEHKTKMIKQIRENAKKIVHCDLCNTDYEKGYMLTHNNTKRHLALLEKANINNPKNVLDIDTMVSIHKYQKKQLNKNIHKFQELICKYKCKSMRMNCNRCITCHVCKNCHKCHKIHKQLLIPDTCKC